MSMRVLRTSPTARIPPIMLMVMSVVMVSGLQFKTASVWPETAGFELVGAGLVLVSAPLVGDGVSVEGLVVASAPVSSLMVIFVFAPHDSKFLSLLVII